MAFLPPIGVSDFRRVREGGLTYVDKTALVSQVLALPSSVLLLPRPRRFGKTLNLSTLRYFLERRDEDLSVLFEGLRVWNDPEARIHFQRYPVVFLSFKDIKHRTWADCLEATAAVIAQAAKELRNLGFADEDQALLAALIEGRASAVQLGNALGLLTRLLAAHHGQPVVVLIDEYDTPIHSGFVNGYYDDVIGFFRNFLSAGLKDNVHLFKGVVTGALENLFSGLNNLDVFGLLEQPFSDGFGFTEDEVAALAREADAEAHLPLMQQWYNGYRFADAVIYNPWSVLKFLGDPAHRPIPHWVATGSNDLLSAMLRGGLEHPADIETLMAGGSVEHELDESFILRDLVPGSDAVWSLLFHSGYLTATAVRYEDQHRTLTLAIPNLEVRTAYRAIFSDYVRRGDANRVKALTTALFEGDAESFGEILADLVLNVMSFHDFGPRTTERAYHAFLAGLLVSVAPTHEVRSNRESGHGRYDVALLPLAPGAPGVVMELKVLKTRETVDQALAAAERQIIDRRYAAELRARGAAPIQGFAVVFDGKDVQVRSVKL